MDETWVVRPAAADDVTAWLEDLAALAQREQAANPLRAQAPIERVAVLAPLALPLPVRSDAERAVAIYSEPPSARAPFGRLLLLALVEPAPRGALRLEIVTDPAFALRGDEVRWHLRRRFAHAVRGASGRRTGLRLAINQPEAGAAGRMGAPVLACNIWLEEQLAALPPGSAGRRRLFRPWLEQYRALRGEDPVDPLRSFRAAVAGCEQRLARRRA